jgi:hypothetical protein
VIHETIRLRAGKEYPSGLFAGEAKPLLLDIPIIQTKARILCADFAQSLLA